MASEPLWLVENDEVKHALWALGLPAAIANGKPLSLKGEQQIAILRQSDHVGELFVEHAAKTAFGNGYSGALVAVPIESLEGLTKDALRAAWRQRTVVLPEAETFVAMMEQSAPDMRSRLVTKRLGDYTPEPVTWLWNQRVPLAKITVMAGDAGEGKSFCTVGIAAALTTGAMLPGGSTERVCSVLMWNGEDGPSDTIYARAESAGADLSRIHIIEEVAEDGERRPFGLQHLPMVAEAIDRDPTIEALFIDPITALLAGIKDSKQDTEIRTALQPLADLAQRSRVAVVLVMHLNKSEHNNVLHRLSGSVAFGALARSVLFVGTHAISGRKAIDTIKHNLARGRPEPVEFCLGEEGFSWAGIAPELTEGAIRASMARASKGARGEGAQDFLRALLEPGPVRAGTVYREARNRGIADRTLTRAKDALRVKARKTGIGEGAFWTWELPEAEEGRSLPPEAAIEERQRHTSNDVKGSLRRQPMAEEDAAFVEWLEGEFPS